MNLLPLTSLSPRKYWFIQNLGDYQCCPKPTKGTMLRRIRDFKVEVFNTVYPTDLLLKRWRLSKWSDSQSCLFFEVMTILLFQQRVHPGRQARRHWHTAQPQTAGFRSEQVLKAPPSHINPPPHATITCYLQTLKQQVYPFQLSVQTTGDPNFDYPISWTTCPLKMRNPERSRQISLYSVLRGLLI